MIFYKTREEVEKIKESGKVLGKVHAEVAKNIKPGIKTNFLDKIAEEYIKDNGGIPSFKNYNGFPFSLCISVNDTVVHGFPGEYELREGDIVSIDCGVKLNGYHSDSAYTYPIGEVTQEIYDLLIRTKQSLYKGISVAEYGKRIGDIGFEIQAFVEKYNYGVVRELVGHGIGKKLHEGPEVPNYGKRGQGIKMQDGLVIAIEPMINLGNRGVVQENDGWTIRTIDRKASAHYEHTVAIFKEGTEVLTTFEYIEEVFKF